METPASPGPGSIAPGSGASGAAPVAPEETRTPSGTPTRQGSEASGGTPVPQVPGSPGGSATAHAEDETGAGFPGVSSGAPLGALVAMTGAGTVHALEIPPPPVPAAGRTVTYSVEIEDRIPVRPTDFARSVRGVLMDTRGWQAEDSVRFDPVSPSALAAGAQVDVRVTLASPTLTARLCAPLNVSTQQVSCWNGGRAVLNLARWILGSSTYGSDLAAYRVYLVNHEVGHGLGHQHAHCSEPNRPAPVMVQQTKSLEGCIAWPYPRGA